MKKIEDQGKKQIESLKEHEKKPVESNELVKKDFKIDRDSTPLDGQKKKRFNKLVEEKSYGFQNLKEKINPNNLIYNYKTEGKKSERSW